MPNKLLKSDAEWRQELSEEQFYVTRQSGTEPAFSGIYVDHDDEVNPEIREVNRLRCVAGMLIVINMINTQLEIDQLKEMFG